MSRVTPCPLCVVWPTVVPGRQPAAACWGRSTDPQGLTGRLGLRGASGETDARRNHNSLQGDQVRNKKKLLGIGIITTTLLAAGVAFAAWNAGGTGSGYAKATTAQALSTT